MIPVRETPTRSLPLERLGEPWLLTRVRTLIVYAPEEPRPASRWWRLGLAFAVLCGVVLRLAWVNDIEYKADEEWTFQQTRNVGKTEPFPWLGMPSSAEVRNPGMSVWVFLLLGKLGADQDPTSLARAVQILNVAALVLLVWLACRWVPKGEREPWLWAAALASVCPLAVLFQRKIWPPSVLPLCTLVLLMGWWRRDRGWGAFTWGLIGACLGQIHMSGFFFAAGFAAWAFLFDRKRVAWKGWLAGSFLGALPMIPWFHYLATEFGRQSLPSRRWSSLLEFKFWTHWVTEPFGIGLRYTLGDDFGDFLGYPLVGGHPTYLVALLHGIVLAVGLVIGARAVYRLWCDRRQLPNLFIGRGSESAFTQNAVLWGFGILLTLPCLAFQRHYLIIAFPLGFVWLARLALGSAGNNTAALKLGRTLLLVLCVSELLISAHFLGYIHVNQRTIPGHYQRPYGAQIRARGSPAGEAGEEMAASASLLP